jgi:hypothetical protein
MLPNLVGFDTDFQFLDHHPSLVQIRFQSTLDTDVSFKIDLQTGRVFEIEHWSPQAMIPNWHTDAPLTHWTIQMGTHIIKMHTADCIDPSDRITHKTLLSVLTNQTIRDIWIGKYGYRVHR